MRQRRPLLETICLLLGSFLFSGCTSIQYSNYKQAVRITSAQPGAEIRYKGELLGVTPAYVRIGRERDPVIELSYLGQQPLKYHIDTRYRWADSFVPGLFGYVLAPVFIYLDIYTGTAWNLKSVNDVTVPGQAPFFAELQRKQVAIAPPQVPGIDYSDQVGEALQSEFTQKITWKIYPFKSTDGIFEDAHYTNDNVSTGADRSELFADLKATHILESKPAKKDATKLEYSLRNVFTDQIEETGSIDLPARRGGLWLRVKHFFIGLIPNSVTLDAASRTYEAKTADEKIHKTKAEPLAGWLGDFSRFAGSFGFTNLIPPGRRADFEGHIRLVSSADFNFSQFAFDTTDFPNKETKYKLSRGVVAAGPQFYLETVLGIFYFDLMLGGAYSRIKWDGEFSGSTDGASIQSILGFGYYRYFSNRIGVRLFVKRISEDIKLWNEAVKKSQGGNVYLEDIGVVEGGLSLVFYLPEAKRKLRNSQTL